WYASSLGRCYGASMEAVLSAWLSSSKAKRVLDVGCGPGLAAERLFTRDAEVWGLDCSLEMAYRARARSEKTGVPRFIVVGSVVSLPFPDGTFDLVSCVNCLEFVEDRHRAFREIARVLAPAGRAVLAVLNRRSLWEITRRLRRPLSRTSYYDGRFFSEQELRDRCTAAGLDVADCRSAVHFPPIPPGPLARLYLGWDRWACKRRHCFGGVLLCHATKPAKTAPRSESR
ncbi:MAG: class I SAM-dependent methyltransferase, partial [Planctomycetes bacterium]|nr:class I SAM-dependent methyltransferase [Planctomycetota bacterium]